MAIIFVNKRINKDKNKAEEMMAHSRFESFVFSLNKNSYTPALYKDNKVLIDKCNRFWINYEVGRQAVVGSLLSSVSEVLSSKPLRYPPPSVTLPSSTICFIECYTIIEFYLSVLGKL